MAPSFCPALTTILFHLPLSSANSLPSPTTRALRISLLTQSSYLNRGLPLFLIRTLLSLPIRSLCHSLFPHPHHMSSPFQPAFKQSPRQTHLHTNLLPQFIHPPSVHPLHSHNPPNPVVLTNLQPLLSHCQCHCLQTVKGRPALHTTSEPSLSIFLISLSAIISPSTLLHAFAPT